MVCGMFFTLMSFGTMMKMLQMIKTAGKYSLICPAHDLMLMMTTYIFAILLIIKATSSLHAFIKATKSDCLHSPLLTSFPLFLVSLIHNFFKFSIFDISSFYIQVTIFHML